MRLKTKIILAIIVSALSVTATAGSDSSGIVDAIAVVVNTQNPMVDISFEKMQRIYLGRKTTFDDGHSIVLMEYKPLQDRFYRVLLDRSASKMRKLWMKKVFAGDYATPPVVFEKIDDVVEFLEENTGGICFFPSDVVTDNMKVISIDGYQPEDEFYPLVGASDK